MSKGMKSILVVAEIRGEEIRPVTWELVAAAARIRTLIADDSLSPEIRILVPGENPRDMARDISLKTGMDVISLAWPAVTPESLKQGLVPVLEKLDPGYLLFGHSTLGREVAPGLAARLGAASVSGVTQILCDSDGIGFSRPVMDNTRIQTVRPCHTGCCVLTLAPGAFARDAKMPEQEPNMEDPFGKVLELTVPMDVPALKTTRRTMTKPFGDDQALGATGLKSANIVVTAGQGIGDLENLEKIFQFAGCFPNAAVGASRPLVDQGWIPYRHQVGITGATVTPELYIACGISGSSQHLAGMSGAKWVVSINTSADAPIRNHSDIYIQADVLEFIEAFLEIK